MHFSSNELADLERSLKRLILAAHNMIESLAAANFLLERHDLPGDVRRALETAIPVAYARPWGKSNTIGALEPHWLPTRPVLRTVHDEMILVRNKVYAHTDEEINARWILGMSEAMKLRSLSCRPGDRSTLISSNRCFSSWPKIRRTSSQPVPANSWAD